MNWNFIRERTGRDFLYSLTPKLRAKAFSDIEMLRTVGNDLTEPYVKPVKGKKKSMKLPQTEIDKARKYMEDYIRRCE